MLNQGPLIIFLNFNSIIMNFPLENQKLQMGLLQEVILFCKRLLLSTAPFEICGTRVIFKAELNADSLYILIFFIESTERKEHDPDLYNTEIAVQLLLKMNTETEV